MKKVISLFFACLLCIGCFAYEFEAPPVVDGAGYLTGSQIAELTDRLENIRQTYNFDVAVVTESTMSSYDAMSSADDIFDYRGYGAGARADGVDIAA